LTRSRLALPLVGVLAVTALGVFPREAAAQRRNPFDPFRTGNGAAATPAARPAAPPAAPVATPGRLLAAASQPAPSTQPAPATQPAATRRPAPTSQPAATARPAPSSQPAATPTTGAPLGAEPGSRSCTSEADCPQGSFCEAEQCVPLRFRLNVLYLYYRSPGRTFTEAAGVYWHQRGKAGYRVLAPFYWHFWRPTAKLQAVAPFYWHAVDYREHLATTVVPPFQWGSAPGEKYFRLWPFVFWSDYGKAGASFSLVPLLHWARRGTYSAGGLFPLGFYASDTAKQSSTAQVLLYYRHRSPEWRSDALWPLFYAGRSPHRAFTWAAPLNFYWRRGRSTHFLSVPFAYYAADRHSSLAVVPAPPIVYYRNRDYRFTTGFPLYWRWGTPRSTETMVLPLVYAGHTGASKHLVVFPFLWHFASPGRHTTVFANSWYHRSPTGYSAAVLPLAFFGADRKAGTSHATVLPFFHYSTSAHGRETFVLTPLGLGGRNRDAKTSYLFLLAPPYYRRRDPQREIDTLIPLYLRWKNLDSGTTIQAITPLFWLRSDRTGTAQVLFPAVWRFTDARKQISATVVPPLFYHRSAPGESTTVLATAFYRRDRRSWSAGLAPLLFFGGGADGRHAVIFPWLWHFANATSATTVAAPFFHHRDPHGWSAGLAPLLFAGNRDGDRHFVLFPLVWHFSSEREGRRTTVIGPVFSSRTRTGYRAGLAPIFFFGHDGARSHQIVAPLFWRFYDRSRDDETVVVGPAFRRLIGGHRAGGPRHTEYGLLPLFHYRRTVAPRDTLALTVAPLFHYSRAPGTSLVVTPLGGFRRVGDRETLVAGPYVHRRTADLDGHFLFPLFGHWRTRRTNAVTDLLLPIAVFHRSPARSAAVVFPFVWYFRDGHARETDLTVFPFYSRVRSPDLNVDVAFPLVWSFRSPKRRTLVVLSGYHSRGLAQGSLDVGVLPLFAYHRTAKTRVFASLPFLYFQSWPKEQRTLQVVGPFWRATYPDGYSTGLFPLGYVRDRGPKRQALLFPLVWHSSDSAADVHTNVVLPFLYRRAGKERTYAILPALWLKTKPSGASVTVFPAFHVASDAERVRVMTAALGFQWGRGVHPSWGYLGPIWWLRKKDWSADGLFPLVWRFHDLPRRRQTFMLAPFWYSRVAPDSAFYAAFPLVWRSRSIAKTTTVVLPFYFDVDNRYKERTTLLFPFGWRHYTAEDRTTTWAALPSLLVRQRPEATDAFLFPLLWHWGGVKRSTTIVAPIYWDFKRGVERSTVVFPLVWRFQRADADTWVVANTYYRKGLGKHAGTYRFVFVPLFEVARPRPGDLTWEVLSGLVGYSRVGRNRVLRLFWQEIWLSQPPPASQPKRRPGRQRAAARRVPAGAL
jgi:hypothetical protein